MMEERPESAGNRLLYDREHHIREAITNGVVYPQLARLYIYILICGLICFEF